VQQFIAGFVVALLGVVGGCVLFLGRKFFGRDTGRQIRGSGQDKNGHLKELEELSKLTGELAHEIKNPLSTIKINLKLISEELEGSGSVTGDRRQLERALRKMSVIRKETDRLEQILDGFLRYIDRTELELASVDLNALISDMVDFYSPQAYSHSITIRQGLFGEPLVCKIDEDMLKRVILNLFINAGQATSDGGELIIKTYREQKDAVIEISDTGCGIAPDRLARIFDAYYSSRPQGSGLGLATAKKIVEAHNGKITVNSKVGKGTSFTIKLPIQGD
jgi:two-component system sensor histidine kinase HydH